MKIKNLIILLVGSLLWNTAQGAIYNYDWTVNTAIPDGDLSGLQDTHTLSGIADTHIESVSVTLNLAGGYNGDLYAYVTHSSGFSVLLNRVGKTSSDAFGTGDTGFLVTLSSAGANDIHQYAGYSPTINGSGQLTGTWQPDARNINPLTVLDTDSRTAGLDTFYSLDPNGTWTLFVADVAYGDQTTLAGWGLNITAAPEPTTLALPIFAGLFALRYLVLRIRSRHQTGRRSLQGHGGPNDF